MTMLKRLLAYEIGLKIPMHGLLWSKDNTLTFFIKRFDRKGQNDKVPVEDFAQCQFFIRRTERQIQSFIG